MQPGEEKAVGDLISVCKYLMEGVKEMEPGSSQWCPMVGPEAVGTRCNTQDSICMERKCLL